MSYVILNNYNGSFWNTKNRRWSRRNQATEFPSFASARHAMMFDKSVDIFGAAYIVYA